MTSGNNQDNLSVAFIDKNAVVRVVGRGSFKVSPALKQFVHQVADRQSATKILLDMDQCIGMDSTFMGVLAGLSCYIRNKSDMSIQLINLSDKNEKLLCTLGVDKVVKYCMKGDTSIIDGKLCKAKMTDSLPSDLSDKLNAAKTTLEAHETLVDINPENYDKFKSVLEFLEDDIKNLSK